MKENRRKKIAVGPGSDITLGDFADSPDARARLKKSQSGSVLAKGGEELVCEDWAAAADDEEDTASKHLPGGKQRQKSPKKTCQSSSDDYEVQTFPYDFWELLSNYIKPEDIGRFAQICKMTHYIVSSQSFWRRLYERYYKDSLILPQRLRPDCMMRPRGLKACVIKMLHLTHPPFLSAGDARPTVWPDLDILLGNQCVLQWVSIVSRRQCLFYFKLRDPGLQIISYNPGHQEEDETSNRDLEVDSNFLASLTDINYNPEEGCKLLQVNGVSYCNIPPLLGLTLQHVSLSVSHGMRHHKLQLEFGERDRGRSSERVRVLIDSVVNLKVVNWWSPQYREQPPRQQHTPTRAEVLMDPFGS